VRAASAGAVLAALLLGAAATPAAANRNGDDLQLAKAGTLALSDLPAGFATKPDTGYSKADHIRLAKGINGCGPYIALEKTLIDLPSARSASLEDQTRKVDNEVDVFKNDRAAIAALALYARPSLVGCLEQVFEKGIRQDPSRSGDIDDVVVMLERQDIAGLGDESVVYEGSVVVTGTDGSRARLGIGNAAVRVGRTVDALSFSTSGGDLADILTSAIDASVGRLRSALGATPA
jgi:hypothetical protein